MNLLIDIGNTRVKWVEQSIEQLSEISFVGHQQDGFESILISTWRDLLIPPDTIYIACVSTSSVKKVITHIIKQLWAHAKVQDIQTCQYAHGVTNSYINPEKLGVDRWLAMLGAYNYYTAPLCVIDCGTAITLDVLDEQGQHLGGMIMPGLTLLNKSLSKGAANLDFCSEDHKLGLANYTQAAIYNGNLSAVRGFIEAGRQQYKSQSLILTGGDAEYINNTLALGAIVDLKLVFSGISLLSSESQK